MTLNQGDAPHTVKIQRLRESLAKLSTSATAFTILKDAKLTLEHDQARLHIEGASAEWVKAQPGVASKLTDAWATVDERELIITTDNQEPPSQTKPEPIPARDTTTPINHSNLTTAISKLTHVQARLVYVITELSVDNKLTIQINELATLTNTDRQYCRQSLARIMREGIIRIKKVKKYPSTITITINPRPWTIELIGHANPKR